MSYGVRIKRLKVQGPNRIMLEEWLAYVRLDREMRHIGEAVNSEPEGRDNPLRSASGLTEWIDPQTGHKTLFDHQKISGTVSVGNPSREALIKTFKVAEALQGVVQGDEGEC
jgi:hypothetical protein